MRAKPSTAKKKKINVDFKDFPLDAFEFDFINRGEGGETLRVWEIPGGIKVRARREILTFPPREESNYMKYEENGIFIFRLVMGCFLGALIISALEGLITH
jgi:hypothetical protein